MAFLCVFSLIANCCIRSRRNPLAAKRHRRRFPAPQAALPAHSLPPPTFRSPAPRSCPPTADRFPLSTWRRLRRPAGAAPGSIACRLATAPSDRTRGGPAASRDRPASRRGCRWGGTSGLITATLRPLSGRPRPSGPPFSVTAGAGFKDSGGQMSVHQN